MYKMESFPIVTLQLLTTLSAFRVLFAEPVPLDLAEQHGKYNHHGYGDVVELWEENENNTKMRNALRSTAQNRWTIYRDIADAKFVIPFIIGGKFDDNDRQTIQEAMDNVERNTCLKFRPRKENKEEEEKDFVDIQNEYGEGCYTNVGRISGRNVLMLESADDETCVTKRTVLHELMHKIGLWHEQMRSDRDQYIDVLLDNIPFYLHAQFRKVNDAVGSSHGVRYDYRSIMHYGAHAFARPAEAISMRTKRRRFQQVIGSEETASAGDYIKICAMYGCPVCMGEEEEFDAEKAAKEFGRSQEMEDGEQSDEGSGDDTNVPEAEPACTPLSLCGTAITRQTHGISFRSLCCEPCSECQPEPYCTESWMDPQRFPHLYQFDCCGRCGSSFGRKKKEVE